MHQERLGELIEKFKSKHQDDGLIINHEAFLKFYMYECLSQCKVPTWEEWTGLKRLYEGQMGVQWDFS